MAYYTTNLDNVQLYYEDQGNGEPLVFVHGWSGSCKAFVPIIKDLRSKYRCISYDHRGHGASSRTPKGLTIAQLAADLEELITYLGLKDVTLVGHSMGAATIYSYLGQFGCKNIKNCVFIDMAPWTLNDAQWQNGYREETLYDLNGLLEDIELMNQDFGLFQLRFKGTLMPELKAIPAAIAPLLGPGLLGANDALILKSLWFSMFITDHRPSIEKLAVPTLYVFPEKGLYPIGAPEFIRDHAQAPVEILTVPGASHLVPMEQPALIAECIDKLLSK